jgi:hypothetical protein
MTTLSAGRAELQGTHDAGIGSPKEAIPDLWSRLAVVLDAITVLGVITITFWWFIVALLCQNWSVLACLLVLLSGYLVITTQWLRRAVGAGCWLWIVLFIICASNYCSLAIIGP